MSEVVVDSDGCRLAGTFTTPEQPCAAAVVLPGSGRVDRDSNTRRLRLEVTRAVAEALTAAGVATIRYDKRGVGASGGDFLRAGFTQQLVDARAAVGWLTARVPGVPIIAVGHSEGGLHAIELAADGHADGAVLLSTPARSGEQVLRWQGAELVRTLPRWLAGILRVLGLDPLELQRKRIDRIRGSTRDVMRIQGIRINARWFREFAAHDPRPALARITGPVLAITGAHDVQVPPDDIATMRALVAGPFEGHVVDDLNHLLRGDPDRVGPRHYRRSIREPVDPGVLHLITDWVRRHYPCPPR